MTPPLPHSSVTSPIAEPTGPEANRAALDFIFSRLNFERVPHDSYTLADFKLDRMRSLLEEIGNPQERLATVHLAGTKGKGSTAAMLAGVLQSAGAKTGLFTSPHIETFEERMTVNGCLPGTAMLEKLVERLRPAVERLDRSYTVEGPTFFELTTALGWLYFEEAGAEIVVLEAGLGGRLDSTNVCRPLCSIITSISRDHMRLLGETLPEIAREKAGIIKPGVPVISGVRDAAPREVIEATAEGCGAPLLQLGREIVVEELEPAAAGLPFYAANVKTPWEERRDLRCPLPGRHQIQNMGLAMTAFDLLSQHWRPLNREAAAAGLANLRWPLRIEQFSERPRLILDAAHNDASIRALCETLAGLPERKRVVVFGTSRDKDARAMLEILADAFDVFVLTRYTENPRALPVDQLEEMAAGIMPGRTVVSSGPAEALQTARNLAGDDGLICVTGSLFLAAEMKVLVAGRSQ